MGNNVSSENNVPVNFEYLCSKTENKDNKGYISVEDICKIKEISNNPLKSKICIYLTNKSKRKDEISFEHFLKLLDTFENKNLSYQKKLLFEIIDIEGKGYITSDELIVLLEVLLGNELSKEEITQLIKKVMSELYENQNKINFEEFMKILD